MFDTMESVAHFVLKPFYRCLAESAARKWIAANLQASDIPCPLGASGLKALFEADYKKYYCPLSTFKRLLDEAGLVRDGEVYATGAILTVTEPEFPQ